MSTSQTKQHKASAADDLPSSDYMQQRIRRVTRSAEVLGATLALTLVLGPIVSGPFGNPQPPVGGRGLVESNVSGQLAERSDQAISSESTVVNVDVLVTDEDGRILSGLKKQNFRMLDDGQPQVITNFVPASAPITIAMLVEYSSGAYNYFASKAASWGTVFLDHLEPEDWVALVTYDLKPSIRVDFTRNKANVRETLASLGFPDFREANLFDALLDTLDNLERVKGKKSILLISTGANTFSSQTLDDVLERLKRTDVTIFCVGLAESEYLNAYGTNIAYLQAKNQLDTFADQTGGITYFPRFEGELPEIFRSVGTFLRNQYSVGFSPLSKDGKYHKIKIDIVGADGKALEVRDKKGNRRKIVVYARQGYIAPKLASKQ